MSATPSLIALRCFDASARLLSFTKAAEEIHLTQGAVSHQILKLETHLGVALFLRRNAGVHLTAAGKAYWAEISAALRQIERATQNMVTHKGEGGALNLCVASSFATHWLIPRLSGFVAAHPEVTLNLSTRIGPVDFSSQPHDAAIEFCEGATASLRAVLVLPLALQPYAAPSLRRNLQAAQGTRRAAGVSTATLQQLLQGYPLIRHTTVPQAWPGWLARAGLQHEVAAPSLNNGPQYDLLSMALNGAIAGLGIALLPEYLAASAVSTGQLEKLSGKSWQADNAYYLRYPEWKSGLVALQRFQTWLEAAKV